VAFQDQGTNGRTDTPSYGYNELGRSPCILHLTQ